MDLAATSLSLIATEKHLKFLLSILSTSSDPIQRNSVASGLSVLYLLLIDGVLETDDVRDFYPTDNRKSFTVMIAGNKVITQLGKIGNSISSDRDRTLSQ